MAFRVSIFATTQTQQKGEIAEKIVETALPKKLKNEIPYLYFTQGQTLFRKNLDPDFFYAPPQKMHQFQEVLLDMDCHVAKKQIFAISSNENLLKFSLEEGFSQVKKSPIGTNLSHISVDWLNDLIYLVSSKGAASFIHQCDTGKDFLK